MDLPMETIPALSQALWQGNFPYSTEFCNRNSGFNAGYMFR